MCYTIPLFTFSILYMAYSHLSVHMYISSSVYSIREFICTFVNNSLFQISFSILHSRYSKARSYILPFECIRSPALAAALTERLGVMAWRGVAPSSKHSRKNIYWIAWEKSHAFSRLQYRKWHFVGSSLNVFLWNKGTWGLLKMMHVKEYVLKVR